MNIYFVISLYETILFILELLTLVFMQNVFGMKQGIGHDGEHLII